MVKKEYVPQCGDFIWIELNPQAGHEQAGRRPALVISHEDYNEITGLCVLFPITTKKKGYPFEVAVTHSEVTGVVLADQIKSLDWRVRNAQFIAKAPKAVVEEAISLFKSLIPE